ncbi:transposase [Patescibacteria group bacterium]|nr:transposase [Patescibacteria group bacterium]MBU1629552.1 transposase [Patescibacteria group bacterium]
MTQLINMGRPKRNLDPSGMYHIIARGNNKLPIFHCVEDYRMYLFILLQAKFAYGFSMYHYVLMPNHVHLLMQPRREKFSACMHKIQTNYAKYFCKKYNFVGHVWQDRFKSLSIETNAYLLACGNYIEMNPVRAGLGTRPEEWAWSSCKFYVFGEKNKLISCNPLYETFAKEESERRLLYSQQLSKTRS